MSLPESQDFAAGELICRAGDPGEFVYFIQEGSVVGSVGGDRVELGRGEIFGDVALASGSYKVTVHAGEQGCRVLEVPLDELKLEIERSPPLVRLLVSNLFHRLEIAVDLLGR